MSDILSHLRKLKIPAISLNTAKLSAVIALFLLLFDNTSFWRSFFKILNGISITNIGLFISLFLALFVLVNLVLSLICFKYVFKPVVVFILISAAFASYFMNAYGIMIDNTMMRNVIETNPAEVFELLSFKMFYYIVFLGIIPSFFVCFTDIKYDLLAKKIFKKLCLILVSGIGLIIIIFPFYKDYSSVFRNHRELRNLMNPGNYLYAAGKQIKSFFNSGPVVVIPIGKDAHVQPSQRVNKKKTIIIFVVGEAARAKNFSLNGYERNTNPLLSKEDIIYFDNFYSCGTSTTVSVPCMFSIFDRESYSSSKGKEYESLLDVLSYAGTSVLWRDNNSSCKGVCDRVETQDMRHLQIADYCNTQECYDEILLYGLQEYVDKLENDAFIILHQKGSHGPAYYLRSPERFKVFQPECSTNELRECPEEEIVNAYDNTILYTDYFLTQVIHFLKKNSDRLNTAMLYASDHGQSLGENNIYLHGLPYFVAPDEQKHIPFILWFSDGFSDTFGIDKSRLREHSGLAYSHDNLFHSILGLTGIETKIYDAKLDIFADCKK